MALSFPNLSKTKNLNFAMQFLIGMLGAAVLFILFHLIEPTKPIATVDVTSMINRFIKSEVAAKRESRFQPGRIDRGPLFVAHLGSAETQIHSLIRAEFGVN